MCCLFLAVQLSVLCATNWQCPFLGVLLHVCVAALNLSNWPENVGKVIALLVQEDKISLEKVAGWFTEFTEDAFLRAVARKPHLARWEIYSEHNIPKGAWTLVDQRLDGTTGVTSVGVPSLANNVWNEDLMFSFACWLGVEVFLGTPTTMSAQQPSAASGTIVHSLARADMFSFSCWISLH